MTVVSTDEQPIQEFRISAPPGSVPASDTLYIDTRIDPETGKCIVLWSDIQEVFEGARSLRNGGRVVSFLTGNDLKKLDPPRISHHPGVILEVVVATPETTGHPRVLSTLCTATPQPRSSKLKIDKAIPLITDLEGDEPGLSMAPLHISDLSIADTETSQNSPTLISPGINSEAQQSIQALNQLYGSFLRAMTSGQEMQVSTIKDAMDGHFEDLKAEMDKNKTLEVQKVRMQEQMARMQEHMAEKQTEMVDRQKEMQNEQQRMRQELSEKQQQILNMQEQALDMHKQALDHLSIIYGRVQAVLTQTYELHEYPIPRLFVVLPKAMRFRDRLGKPFSDQFRLYFLCECGAHTMSEDSKGQHEIHLAKHEGYDIDRPTEFFRKYGPYVLTMMHMIKYGVMAAGIVVPPLAQFKLFEGIEAVEQALDVAEQDITPLVDATITYIKGQSNRVDVDSESMTSVTELERLEVLEGADLRQLESFLRTKDGSRVLGNLYRMVTLEGFVKWVCIDHYRANYQETAVQQLRDVVSSNSGTFIEEKGRIEINISSKTLAKEFYGALVKARGIQELEIDLRWDATLDDLRKFADTITTANVLDLTVDGGCFEGPALDIINRGRRYDPFVQLMFNGRLKALRLRGFRHFFSHVSTPFTTMTSQLQVLEISIGQFNIFKSGGEKETDVRKVLPRILETCHSLVHLMLEFDESWLALDLVKAELGKMKKLEFVTIRSGNIESAGVNMKVSDGRIENVNVYVAGTNYSSSAVKLKANGFLNDEIAQLLDDTTKENGSKLVSLELYLVSLTRVGLESMDRLIGRSHSLREVGLRVDMNDWTQREKAKYLVDKYRNRLTGLYLRDLTIADWDPQIQELCPTRHQLPELTEFRLRCRPNIPWPSLLWICTMVAPPPQRSDPSLFLQQVGSFIPPHESAPVEARTWKSLVHIELGYVSLELEGWRKVVEAIDFSALESLSFSRSNFGPAELKILVDRISGDGNFELPLGSLGFQGTPVAQDSKMVYVSEQLEWLTTMLPLVQIQYI